MANYIKITDYAAKDALLTGNPAKLIKGTEIGADFDGVATAVATKADKGANSDITSLSGLTTALSIAQGGTSATTAAGARTALSIPTPTSFRVDNNGSNIVTIPDITWTRVALSTERHDTNNEFASGTFTAKTAGVHRFYAQVSGAAPLANNALRVRLYKNGTAFAEGRIILVGANQEAVAVYSEVVLAVSDTVDMYVYQDRGTNQEMNGSILLTYFTGGFTGAN